MKLEFLGTGAADWHIENRREDEFFRRFSSLLVDDDLLIDPGPHIYDYAEKSGKPNLFLNVKHILLTHSHPDHLNIDSAVRLNSMSGAKMYGYKTADYKLRNSGVKNFFNPVNEREEYKIGDYTVIAFAANHLTQNPEGEIPFNYIIKKGDKSFFYGADCGWIMSWTFAGLKKYKPDTLIFELTLGDVRGTDHIFCHTSIPMLECMMYSMKNLGVVGENTTMLATHLARTLHKSHEETERRLAPLGVKPMYDGAIIEI